MRVQIKWGAPPDSKENAMSLHDIFYRFPKEFPLPFVLDGATGTALMAAGMPAGVCPEKWIPEHPEVLCEIQRRYYAAGSDAVLAPTFGGNRLVLERHGLFDCAERNAALASISRGLGTGLVAGDLSPTGKFMHPFGDAEFDEIAKVYAEQAASLEPYVDFFVCETNISLAETRAAVTGIKSVSNKPVFATLTVDKSGRTMSGDSLLCALLSLAELGISAFGTNCSVGPGDMLNVLEPLVPFAAGLGVALIAKPNAGMPQESAEGKKFDLDADSFGEYAPKFLEAGVYVLGGCCGTDDKYIKRIREAVDAFEPLEEIPKKDSLLLVCNTKEVAEIDPARLPEPVAADEELFDYEGEYALVRVMGMGDVEFLRDNAAMLPCPIVLCGDRDLCERVIREYCGKTIYWE